jgi:ankyrin repeat protein
VPVDLDMKKPELFDSTMQEDVESLANFIDEVDVNKIDVVGMTALHWGALYGKDKSVAFLLKNNAKCDIPDQDGIRAYDWAKHQGHHNSAQMILLKMQADQMGWHIVNWLAKEGQYKILSWFIDEQNLNIVDKDFGRQALHWAVYNAKISNDRNTLKLLLDYKNIYLDLKDAADGRTALIMGAYFEDLESVRLLINAKADLNVQDVNGDSALMWAAKKQNVALTKLLIAGGAELSLKNSDNLDALALARSHPQITEIVSYCLEHDEVIKKFISILLEIKNHHPSALEHWNTSIEHAEFLQLPEVAKKYLTKAYLRLLKGPSLYSTNIFDKNKQLQPLTKPITNFIPPELLNNQDLLIKRLKSQLNKLF